MGQAHTKLNPGDKCIIDVNEVNYPTGYWDGEVISCVDQGTWFEVKAKITNQGDYEGQQPNVNYNVYPKTNDFDNLIHYIKILQAKCKAQENSFYIRETAYLNAFKAIGEGTKK